MTAARTSITVAEIDAYQARIHAVIDELADIARGWPVGPVWSALGTAHHAVEGVDQALLDLKLGNDRALTVEN
ncbi:hypothetical protein [Kitasatospora sp. NBC_01302]|uniref:hypothetical protein n=1 Tax=Kitasatospora sp. NBC_01302 TaxID=2903575 RepID=UPI002E0E80A0|nr:hypothetical protein OG294_27810 [Kitasatospora sp. NBC_01302]